MMKKLYALLIILIVIYVGINVGANGLNILNSNDSPSSPIGNDAGTGGEIAVGAGSFAKVDGFTEKKINNTAVQLVDKSKNMTIEVQQIDNSTNLADMYNSLLGEGPYTSGQEVDQNGVTAYFLYKEETGGYDTDVYFAKGNQNYKITGVNTTYENSDYFINSCKSIIDSMNGGSSSDGKISRW